MTIPLIENAEEYNKLLASGNTTCVLFSAEWAEQCNQITAVMEQLAKQEGYKAITFLNVAAEEVPEIAEKHQVEAVPTVIFFQKNKAINRIDGIDIAKLTTICKKLVETGSATVGSAGAEAASGSLEDRLKALINKSKIMIFVKGDRNTPRCGFSKQLVQILNDTGVEYETFDILQDEAVRQGLKTFSDWPTYPQVYVSGELIGGLDIVKEMLTNGELVSTLQG
ncbi:unnamed protein product [Diamesa hyperborea]